MKKYFFISNRQSGKTHYAIYEFLKDPENSLLVFLNNRIKNECINVVNIPREFLGNIISSESLKNFNWKNKKYEKIIFDEYLYMTSKDRADFYLESNFLGLKEIYCFTTPNKLYDAKMFNFIRDLKKENRHMAIEEWLHKNELLLEMTELSIKTSSEIKVELFELYNNFITDPDTKIIHDKFFYNMNIYNLNNVSYFPDVEREKSELRGEFFRND